MLLCIRTLNLDFDRTNSGPFGNVKPSIARDGERVHAIGDHRLARTQVFFCHCIRDSIPGFVDLRYQSGSEESLLNRIDAKVDRAQLMSQFSGDFCFSNARKPCEDDETRRCATPAHLLDTLGIACGLGMPSGIAV